MTYKPKSAFLIEMETRGFLQDCTDLQGLDERLLQGTMPAYIGFDATADSLHIGSLIQIMMLRWLQKTGHKPMPLMGGGTTKIGDPSGKDESRQLITSDLIAENITGIQKVFAKYLEFGDGDTDAMMMKERPQRRPFAPCGNIITAKIPNHTRPTSIRQHRPIPQLKRPPIGGIMV